MTNGAELPYKLRGRLRGLWLEAKHFRWPPGLVRERPHGGCPGKDDLVVAGSGTRPGVRVQVEGLWDPRGPRGRHGEGAPHRQHGLGPQVLEGGGAGGLGGLSPLQLDEAGWLALLAHPPTLLHCLQALQLSGLALLNESLHHRAGVSYIGRPRVMFLKQIHREPDVLSEFYWQRETQAI